MMRVFVLGLFFAAVCAVQGSEWTRFRGPNGSGLGEGSFPVEWKKSDFAWEIDLPGTGHGSPVLWEDKIFLLCGDEESGNRMPVCVNAKDGEVLWKVEFDPGNSKRHKFNSVASTTAAVDENQVYFTWGNKEGLTMVAFTHEGKKVWEQDLGPVSGGHGFGASPMVFGGIVVLNNDQEGAENGSLLGLDRKSGEKVWEVERHSQRISYSTPCVFKASDTGKELLVFTNWTHGFTAVDPSNGKVVSEVSAFDQEKAERAIGSPFVFGDMIMGTCGFTKYPKHAVAMRLTEKGGFEEVWRIERSIPHIPSPIYVNDLMFFWDDAGIVTCLEPESGEVIWRERVEAKGEVYGSPVSDGKNIFAVDKEGMVSVIAASREFELLGQSELGDVCRAGPAISGGVMYVRTFGKLFAVKGK